MKVAVASTGNGLDSTVSPVFGRAPFIVFVEVEGGNIGAVEAVPNPGVNASRGAGVVASQLIVGKGAGAAVAGSFGPNAYTLLAQSGVSMYSAGGTVRDAAIGAASGSLPTSASASPGWGAGGGWGRGRGRGMGMGRGMGRGRGRWM